MRTLAEKPEITQRNTSVKSTMPDRAHFGQSRDVNSILHLQRTVGNRAVVQLLKDNPYSPKGVSGSFASGLGDETRETRAGTPLPPEVRGFFESRFGSDLGKVR